jgi:hypothetical protein
VNKRAASRNFALMVASDASKHYGPTKRKLRSEGWSSLMSNAKWQVLIKAVEKTGIERPQVIAKFLDAADEKRMLMPFLVPHTYFDSEFGPFTRIEIEWMEFPAEAVFPRSKGVQPFKEPQDIETMRKAIVATGKVFPMEDTERGFRITGHVLRSKQISTI